MGSSVNDLEGYSTLRFLTFLSPGCHILRTFYFLPFSYHPVHVLDLTEHALKLLSKKLSCFKLSLSGIGSSSIVKSSENYLQTVYFSILVSQVIVPISVLVASSLLKMSGYCDG